VTADLRPALDRCPGVLRPHRAEDGLVVRIRVPGGRIAADALLALTELAGTVQLTSRGNLQLRGVEQARLDRLAERVAALGLLPSPSHELVRNVVASPLTGLNGTRPDLRSLIAELDAAICAAPVLAELPSRFLFAIDDGTRDVWSLDFDIGYLALTEREGLIVVAGAGQGGGRARRGRSVVRAQAADEMARIAADLEQEPACWPEVEPAAAVEPRTPLGTIGPHLCAGVPLGFLTADQAAAIAAAAASGTVVITPWRSVVIPEAVGAAPLLRRAGLALDPDSPWSMITACVGSPGCAKSMIDTRTVAIELARQLPVRPVHISGCERRCGAPAVPHDEVVGRR
jgi:precorrin-3B synthase